MLSTLFFLINCSSSSDVENNARVQLKLVDAPGDYLGVNIEIVDIQFNSGEDNEGWQSFHPETDYPIQVDLTELIAGNYLLLANELLPTGKLNQIRLILSDNNTLEIEGNSPDEIITENLTTPSAQQSGLKLKINQELMSGITYSFILDWDVQESVVKGIVNAGNSEKYILKPVIRVSTEANSGSLKGIVTADILDDGSEHAPLYNATIIMYDLDENLIGQTTTNEAGEYMFYGITPGSYHLTISHKFYLEYASETPFTISLGEILDYGTIELTQLVD